MASLNDDGSSLKNFQTNIICTYMLPDKAIFGAFGPKNTKKKLNMVQDSDDIVLLVNLSTNVPHVTGDQLHQEVGPGSEWPLSSKLSSKIFLNIFIFEYQDQNGLPLPSCPSRSFLPQI